MCGIAGIYVKPGNIGKLPLERLADNLLLGIEPRGQDATGLFAVGENVENIRWEKDDIPASYFIQIRNSMPSDTQTVLLHTRFATQGDKKQMRNNHPVNFESCYVVHNGHISNDDEVFVNLDVERTAEVDSIAIPAALSCKGMADKDNIIDGLKELKGGYAIAAVDPEKHPGQLVLAKGNSSPLWILNRKDCLIWASTKEAIQWAWMHSVGTPTNKETFNWEDGFQGLFQFFPGELMVVNGNQITDHRFQPTEYYTSGSIYTPRNAGTRIKRYYCYPHSWNCEMKCDNGCQGTGCTCSYWEDSVSTVEADRRRLAENEREVERTNSFRASNYGTEILPDGTMRCDSCWDWSSVDELTTYLYGSEEWLLCDDCGEGTEFIPADSSKQIASASEDDLDAKYEAMADSVMGAFEDPTTTMDEDLDNLDDVLSCGVQVVNKPQEKKAMWRHCETSGCSPSLHMLTYREDCFKCEKVMVVDSEQPEPSNRTEAGTTGRELPLSTLSDALAKPERGDESHITACKEVARRRSIDADFVDWLLFQVPVNALEQNSHLAKMREEIEDEYVDAWEMVGETS